MHYTKGSSRAARAARKREQEEYNRAQEDSWKAQVDAHFTFLRERYGFRVTQTEWSVWTTKVRYETDVTAIDVDLSVEFDRVEIRLIRKVVGAVPEYPIFVSAVDMMHYFTLDAVLEERSPDSLAQIRAAKGLGEDQIEQSLILSSEALEEYATDILQGDFTLFTTLEAKVRARLHDHPEVITVHVPADTSPERIAQIKRKAGDPSGKVPVIVRKYQPPAARREKPPEGGSSCNHE